MGTTPFFLSPELSLDPRDHHHRFLLCHNTNSKNFFATFVVKIYTDIKSKGLSDQCTVRPMDCWADGLSDRWTVGPMNCRTDGLSVRWTVGPMDCRTNGLSDQSPQWMAGSMDCRTNGLADQRTVGPAG